MVKQLPDCAESENQVPDKDIHFPFQHRDQPRHFCFFVIPPGQLFGGLEIPKERWRSGNETKKLFLFMGLFQGLPIETIMISVQIPFHVAFQESP